jgi:uncharacterized protein (DUF433 family)
VGRPRSFDHEHAFALHAQGMSFTQIAACMGVTWAKVKYAVQSHPRYETLTREQITRRVREHYQRRAEVRDGVLATHFGNRDDVGPAVRDRKFDHAEALELRSAGATLGELADRYGVSHQAVHQATDQRARARALARRHQRLAEDDPRPISIFTPWRSTLGPPIVAPRPLSDWARALADPE